MKKQIKYRPFIFFLLAFFITWMNGFILAAQSSAGEEKSIINLLLAYLGPFIAALILILISGRQFRTDFRKRITGISLIKLKYLPLTVFLAPLAIFLSILISIIFGQPAEQLRFAEAFKVFDGELILSMIILALVPVLEELGWRGYGVDSLASKFNLFNTSLIFGTLWGLWHLPVFFIRGSYQGGLWDAHPLFAVNFFAGIFPLAVIINYLYYKNNRSILLIALFHVIINYSSEVFEANQISKCINTLVLAVVALIIVLRNKDFFFKDKMRLCTESINQYEGENIE